MAIQFTGEVPTAGKYFPTPSSRYRSKTDAEEKNYRVEEVENPALLQAWISTVDLISALQPTKLIPGHMDSGWELDAQADLAHTKKHLGLFGEKVTYTSTQSQVQELYEYFQNAFPQCKENLHFFLGRLSNQFGEGGETWEENRHHALEKRSLERLNGYLF